MHIYLFLLLFSISAAFLLASCLIKNSDEHDKYVYKFACAFIAFIFFFSMAPMTVDLVFTEPYTSGDEFNYTYINVTDGGGSYHVVMNSSSSSYNATLGIYHYSGSHLFGFVCQGFGYVALAMSFLFALAMVHDLYQERRRR